MTGGGRAKREEGREMVDKNSPLPLYVQLRDTLRAAVDIVSGWLARHDLGGRA